MTGINLIDAQPRKIGALALEVGPLGFGCWRFTNSNTSEATAVLEAALDNGYTLVDNADVYGFDWGGAGFGDAEQILGNVLAASPHLRDRMVLASKGGIMPGVPYDQSPEYLRSACEASLRRLQVDTIDLYQIHRPDMYAHPADVAATLLALRDEGKIREVGVSNFTVAQTDALQAHLPFALATDQPEFSAAHLDPMRDGTFDRCMRTGNIPLAWSTLGGGRLADGGDVRPELLTVLDDLAEREGVDRATIAVGFVLCHPARPVALVGTQRPERLAALKAALTIHLDRTDCYAIVQASEGQPLP
jgi:predicted oxidoreductase